MEYNSFYGGRQGTPFIIAAKYDSVNDMINAFAGGNNYKVVAYNEYVIIDTINKNDADNGKIYRRIETDPGYEYIGQIVGPSGPAPTASFESYSEGEHISEEEPYNIGSPSDLVPGKYVEQNVTKYNDTIKYKYVVVRDVNNIESTIYMGFRIPYPVIDFSVNPILVEYPTAQTVQPERVDDGRHPFYEHWELKIPKGIKGDAFKNFKVGISMLEVDRKDFSEENPYEDSPQRIGFNVNISAPHMHAYALEYLSEFCTENARILDIGSGSGYLTCALSAMTNYKGFVVGVEHIQELINKSINQKRKVSGRRKCKFRRCRRNCGNSSDWK